MQLQVRRGLLSVHLWVSEWVSACFHLLTILSKLHHKMLPPTVFRLSAWARSCTVGLKWASSSHALQHRDSTCCYETNQHKPVCVHSSAWWPCWLYACVVEEVRRREKKKRRKTRQKWKGKSEGRKGEGGRMHSVVRLVCGASAEYTCVVLLPAVWVAEYCVIFRTWDMSCVFTKNWNSVVHSCGSLKAAPTWWATCLFMLAFLVHYAAVSLCSPWSVWRERVRSLPVFVHRLFLCFKWSLTFAKGWLYPIWLFLTEEQASTFSPKEENFSFLLLSSLCFHVHHAHRPLPSTQQQFPDQFLKLAG